MLKKAAIEGKTVNIITDFTGENNFFIVKRFPFSISICSTSNLTCSSLCISMLSF